MTSRVLMTLSLLAASRAHAQPTLLGPLVVNWLDLSGGAPWQEE